MSSGTSINPEARAGFHPWHFFVLASILLATVAVVTTRRGGPEHVILLSLTIAAAGCVAAAFYRMVTPFLLREGTIGDAPLSERRRATLEREKTLTLRAIKELEFDRAMGKLSQKDFDEMAARLRQRALVLMKELDAGVQYRDKIEKDLRSRLEAQSPQCVCGATNDGDAVFCKKCGTKLQAVS